MIQIIIEMDETTGQLQVRSAVPPAVALGVVTSAYHELLSKKIQADFQHSIQLARVIPPNGGRG